MSFDFHHRPHHPHWPASVPAHIAVPQESLWEGLARQAQQSPQGLGLDFLGRTYTWAELVQQATHLAGALTQGLGLQAGQRVLLFMQNCPQYVLAFHAVLRAGGVVVPVNPMNKAVELTHYLTDAQASIAIASSDIAHEMAQAAQQLASANPSKVFHLLTFHLADALPENASEADFLAQTSTSWPAAWQAWLPVRHPLPSSTPAVQVHEWQEVTEKAIEAGVQAPAHQAKGDDLALLPYTSGTTGASKGCMHTHATLLHNALAAGPWLDLRPQDKQLIVAPLFHITGLVMGMLACIQQGATMVILPRWDRTTAALTISQQGITHWPNIPTMVMDLLSGTDVDQYDLSSLRYIGGGGAAMPDAVALRLKTVYGLDYIEGYGLTETAAPTHLNPMHAPKRHCLGIPFVGTQATIIDTQTLKPVPVGELGEIVVHGPQVFRGYWQQEQATAQAFITIDGVRYFRTGDIGRMDSEGYFYIADRLKRMINASGFKVWPAEVEALLHRHPAVKECCVIATRDPYRGESVKALVVLHESHRGLVDPEALIVWSREHMAAYKYPRSIELTDSLPKTATGKVLWRRAQATQDALDTAPPQAQT